VRHYVDPEFCCGLSDAIVETQQPEPTGKEESAVGLPKRVIRHRPAETGRYRELTASVGSSAISSPRKITKLPAQVFSSVSPCR
jgi:hypothetical protein